MCFAGVHHVVADRRHPCVLFADRHHHRDAHSRLATGADHLHRLAHHGVDGRGVSQTCARRLSFHPNASVTDQRLSQRVDYRHPHYQEFSREKRNAAYFETLNESYFEANVNATRLTAISSPASISSGHWPWLWSSLSVAGWCSTVTRRRA